ncbi:MAG TPA: ribbon-helix-helix protein, CopG family [Vicinamibacterales bacterium]
MKAIRISVDEKLLREIDATAEAKREGRSAVFRRAAAEYLRRQHRQAIAKAYDRAYRDGGVNEDLEKWSDEGQWPMPQIGSR